MFAIFGGGENEQPKSPPPEPQREVTSRRTQSEVKELARQLQESIRTFPELIERLSYFWPSPEVQLRLLTTLARDVPRDRDILEPLTLEEDEALRQQDNGEEGEGEEEDDEADTTGSLEERSSDDEAERKRKKKERKRRRKKRKKRKELQQQHQATGGRWRRKSNCVNWLGLVNKKNGYAAVKLQLPGTTEDWVTWANRLVVFVLGNLPTYRRPDDFALALDFLEEGGPFSMRCGNPKCVRLAHIACLPAGMAAHIAQGFPPPVAPLKPLNDSPGGPSSFLGGGTFVNPRSKQKGIGVDGEGEAGRQLLYPPSNSMLPPPTMPYHMTDLQPPQFQARQGSDSTPFQHSSQSSNASLVPPNQTTNSTTIWSPGFQ